MGLWGSATTYDAATNKPKFLHEDENSAFNKGDSYATQKGWVIQAGTKASGNDNTSADPEVLVAIGNLAGSTTTTGLRAPTVTDMRYIIGTTANTDLTALQGTAEIQVEITWDEEVTVVTDGGTPTLIIANGNESGAAEGHYTLEYVVANDTPNRKRFKGTSKSLSVGDVLTIGTNDIVLNTGTISDTVLGGTALAASTVLSGLTAVTHTVLH